MHYARPLNSWRTYDAPADARAATTLPIGLGTVDRRERFLTLRGCACARTVRSAPPQVSVTERILHALANAEPEHVPNRGQRGGSPDSLPCSLDVPLPAPAI